MTCFILLITSLFHHHIGRINITTDFFVAIKKDNILYIGKLDNTGDFSCLKQKQDDSNPSSGFPIYQVINYTRNRDIDAMEYRSGLLVLGQLKKDGRFVPKEQSSVISIRNYSTDMPIIWNYPYRVFIVKE